MLCVSERQDKGSGGKQPCPTSAWQCCKKAKDTPAGIARRGLGLALDQNGLLLVGLRRILLGDTYVQNTGSL